MAPTDRLVPCFAAEPPQEGLPYGRWAHRLSDAFYRACDEVEAGHELFGHVSFVPAAEGGEPSDVAATADFTAETAERNPHWQLDLSDDVIGTWRGEEGRRAQITLVYGRPLRAAGAIATAELADLAVDQCALVEDRFSLIAPDDYRGDTIEVKLFDARGREVARESLYEDDAEEEGDEAD